MKKLLFFVLLFTYLCAAREIDLTPDEEEFLKQHPVIRVHNEQSWAPFNFNANDKPQGFSIEYMHLLAKKAGFEVEFINGPSWSEFLQMIQNNELDVMLNIVQTPLRSEFLNFTKESYISTTRSIIKRKDDLSINDFSDLSHKTVAIEKGFFYEEYLKQIDPTIKLLLLPDTVQTLHAVSTGEADATIGVLPVQLYLIDKYFLSNLMPLLDPKVEILKAYGQKIGVTKRMPELVGILDKAMGAITYDELSKLNAKWFHYKNASASFLDLSAEEKEYIKNNPVVSVAFMQDYFPYSFTVDNEPKGISNEILAKIAEYTGLRFSIVPDFWGTNIEKFQNKKVQIIDSISYKKERETFAKFTKPYHEIPIVLFARKEFKTYEGLQSLQGKRVGVTQDVFFIDELKKIEPKIEVVEYKSVDQRMQDLAYGKLDAVITSFVSGNRAINRYGLSNLHVLSHIRLPRALKEDLRYGIDADNALLYSIFNKAFEFVRNNDLHRINNNWLRQEESQQFVTNNTFLTVEENEFLKQNNHTFTLCVERDDLPYQRLAGDYFGIYSEIIKTLKEKTNIDFRFVQANGQKNHLSMLKNNECDLSLSLFDTQISDENLYKSSPFWESKVVILTRDSHPFIESLDEIKNGSIGYLADEKDAAYLQNFDALNLVRFATLQELLIALSSGKIDAYIGSLAKLSYTIKSMGILNLKIAAATPYVKEHVAVFSSKNALLHGIIEKTLANIGEDEKNNIRSKWINVKVDKHIQKQTFYQIVIAVFFIIVILLFRHFQLKKLNKTIEKQNAKLQKALDELSQAQKKLIESEKMAALGNIVSGVAHEINTPLGVAYTTLTAMQTIEQKIKKDLSAYNDEKLIQYSKKLDYGFSMIEHNLKRAADLIQSFKRISVSQHMDSLAHIKLKSFIQDVAKSLKYEYIRNAHTIVVDESANISLTTYSGALAQIVTNLIMNSLKHGFKNQTKKQITIRFIQTKKGVDIHYLDNGSGIDPSIAQKIYEPFFTTDRQDGTGLGMHLVYNLVTQKLQGDIRLVPSAQGVHFVISVPDLKKSASN
jgi:ABC-type amino acid transport substrate-binding protein/nitrogen-specific signal transduction histidine kinase